MRIFAFLQCRQTVKLGALIYLLRHIFWVGGKRNRRHTQATEADAYCTIFSRYGTRIYTLYVYIHRIVTTLPPRVAAVRGRPAPCGCHAHGAGKRHIPAAALAHGRRWLADAVLISKTRLKAVAQQMMRAQAGASG